MRAKKPNEDINYSDKENITERRRERKDDREGQNELRTVKSENGQETEIVESIK